jgi:hypothetical protein
MTIILSLAAYFEGEPVEGFVWDLDFEAEPKQFL